MTRPRVALTAALLALTLGLAACGGGDDGASKTAAAPAATTGSSEADKPAQEILQDMAKALGQVRSYHVAGTQKGKDGTMRLEGDVAADGRVNLTVDQQGSKIGLIVVGRDAYFKADADFWRKTAGPSGAALAKRLANRWVKSPSGADKDMRELVDSVNPKTLSYCATRNVGELTKNGTADVDGQQAIVLVDAGSPGSSPGKIFIAAEGRPLPLRIQQTGPDQPGGGKPDPRCDDDDSDDDSTGSDVRLSDFDQAVDIVAPPDAIDLSQLGGGGQKS
jgi:hypothetical protein